MQGKFNKGRANTIFNNLKLSSIERKKLSRLIIIVPLALSAFTHLWNPAGFPDVFYDEGVYMRRAMHILDGQGPQEGSFYDHPYFGPLFLASFLGAVGFPDSVNPNPSAESIQLLYSIPRILMGLLAIIDTFLIFKISEKRYGSRVALIASVLSAAMPISWLTRRILLDSILLPFLLTSILFAMHARGTSSGRSTVFIALSGIFLGACIFTKIPVFTTIPMVAYLIYSAGHQKGKNLVMWFLPVVLIPAIWPVYSASEGQFDFWLEDVIWQTQRESGGFASIVVTFFISDPVSLIMGIVGIAFAVLRKDILMLLWLMPFVLFLIAIGYVQYFYWIPVLPVFWIAAAILIDKLAFKWTLVPYVTVAAIGIFGLVSTLLFITTDMTSAQFEATTFVAAHTGDDTTIVASPVYSWLFIYVFEIEHARADYRELLYTPVETRKLVLVSDNHLVANLDVGTQIRDAYQETESVRVFLGNVNAYDTTKYPYSNLGPYFEGISVDIRQRN